ncbi:MAG: hypothetical protein IKH69_08115 [Bacteroidaceae bacterium]|nr:hypothetical protein [Bacteroidaceae bacterium]
MCTVTLSYDQNNALARRKLAALLKTGLFEELSNTKRATDKEKAKHVEEVESIMNASKKSMSHIIERYL